MQGLARLVVVSLRKLVDLLSPEKIRKNQDLPMLIIDLNLNLTTKTLRFSPDVRSVPRGSESFYAGVVTYFMGACSESEVPGNNLYDLVGSWVNSFMHAATCLKRLDGSEGRYVKEMVDDLEVQVLLVLAMQS